MNYREEHGDCSLTVTAARNATEYKWRRKLQIGSQRREKQQQRHQHCAVLLCSQITARRGRVLRRHWSSSLSPLPSRLIRQLGCSSCVIHPSTTRTHPILSYRSVYRTCSLLRARFDFARSHFIESENKRHALCVQSRDITHYLHQVSSTLSHCCIIFILC